MINLSIIIKEKYAQEYKEELTKFISYAMTSIQKKYGQDQIELEAFFRFFASKLGNGENHDCEDLEQFTDWAIR